MNNFTDKTLNSLNNILKIDKLQFESEFGEPAQKVFKEQRNHIYVNGLLGLSNMCRNNCTYCGLRRGRKIPRYTLEFEKVTAITNQLATQGVKRIFYVSGENNVYKFDDYLKLIENAKAAELEVNLAAGIFEDSQYKELKEAGLDFYTLKFESSNEKIFSEAKPDISLKERLKSIEGVKKAGLMLGSGNIIGLKGQTISDLAKDIRLMVKLEIDWAPVVPFLPAPETPMGETTPMGSVDLTLRTISILRLLLPKVRITAGQPTQGSTLGFSDPAGNIAAIKHGADSLFVELTPLAMAEKLDITPGRKLPRLEEIKELIKPLELEIC
ncbi:MAG: radical SAM protein [Spirochaetales bacterium]|nr:radical SAM protein [Spirochaetales bacterium]